MFVVTKIKHIRSKIWKKLKKLGVWEKFGSQKLEEEENFNKSFIKIHDYVERRRWLLLFALPEN